MLRLVEQMPVERMIVIPFALLAELAAHEHQLLAGMGEHEGVIGAQIGKALPVVAGHPAQHRAFAVHDLVMRQRQDEIFREGVVQAEQDLAVMMLAVDRILADVVQRVVHPAHVPFVAEAEPAIFDRARHLRPGGGFFRGRGGLRKSGEHLGVEAAQEFDGLEIFAAAIFVRNPAAGGPAVVEIQHRGDGIDAQAVDGVALQPEQRVRHQEIDHFGAAVIVDQRAPVHDGGPAAGWRARRARCRRNWRGRADRPGNARAPSPAARRCPRDGRHRPARRNPPGVPNRLVGAYMPVG